MVVEVTVDGKSVPSDSPLVTRRPFPAPSQYTGIAFGSKKLRGDVAHICQEKTEDEVGKPVTGLHKAIVLKSNLLPSSSSSSWCCVVPLLDWSSGGVTSI